MLGWKLLRHSIMQVFGNFGPLVRISALLYLPQAILEEFPDIARSIGQGPIEPKVYALWFLVYLAVFFVSSSWIAIAFHRYVFVGEHPDGILPVYYGDILPAYLWRAGQIAAAVVIPMLVIAGAANVLLTGHMLAVRTVGAYLGAAAMVFAIFFYRLCPALSGDILGRPMTFRQAWRATAKAGVSIVVMYLSFVAGTTVIEYVVTPLVQSVLPLSVVWNSVFGWAKLMIGFSLMITVYGHYVQGRALV